MSSSYITLKIMDDNDLWRWNYKNYYTEGWPGYDWASFIRADQISKEPIIGYKEIQVEQDAIVSDVIKVARTIFFDPAQDDDELWPVSYSLLYPGLSDEPLHESARLSDLGVIDGELMAIRRVVHTPPPLAYAARVKDFTDFQRMVTPNGDPDLNIKSYKRTPELYATLLYTDDDITLAKYVREHFDDLHKMSGTQILVFVVEKPPQNSAYASATFWKGSLDQAVYLAWSLMGWTRSKPYDKSTVYEIAQSIGVYPDQLPCMVVFDHISQTDKIVMPISTDFPTFFRNTFSNIQRCLKNVKSSDLEEITNSVSSDYMKISWEEIAKRNAEAALALRNKRFERVKAVLQSSSIKEEETIRTVYNFYGQTVFINHPTGSVQLSNFQNTSDKEEASE